MDRWMRAGSPGRTDRPHHDVPVAGGAAAAHSRVGVGPAPRDARVRDAAGDLVGHAVGGRPGRHGSLTVDRDHGDGVVVLPAKGARRGLGDLHDGAPRPVRSARPPRVGENAPPVIGLAVPRLPLGPKLATVVRHQVGPGETHLLGKGVRVPERMRERVSEVLDRHRERRGMWGRAGSIHSSKTHLPAIMV